jgi:hemolysin activation/secretion protein
LVFGGAFSVRGFEEQAAARDQGVLLEAELRAPPISTGLGKRLGAPRLGDQLTPFLFVDYGYGWNRHAYGQKTSMQLGSASAGLNWQIGRYLSARLSYGIPVLRRGQAGPSLRTQFGFQLSL